MTRNDISVPVDGLATGEPLRVRPDQAAIDALLDGEDVDKDALRTALADADARDYFIDALLLRRLAADMGPLAFEVAGRSASPAARATRWLTAAAVVITTAAAGYAVGRESRPDQMPAPAADPTSISTDSTTPPPEPTTVIRFERGKNWVSDVEGH